jgi:hypothetical protein
VSDNRARLWFSVFVLAVFCLGAASGFVVGRHAPPLYPHGPDSFDGRARGRPGPFGRPFGGPPPLPPDLVERLSSELQLDVSQQDQVKRVLDERRDRLEQVHRDARDRFEKEQRELHAAIRAVLRPDQQAKFDNFLERRRK